MVANVTNIDMNLRKLGTPQLARKVRRLVSTLNLVQHPLLAEAWQRIELDDDPRRSDLLDLGDAIQQLSAAPDPMTSVVPQMWTDLANEVRSTTLAYPLIQFPISVGLRELPAEPNFVDCNGVPFMMDEMGAGYLSERIPSVKYAIWTKWWRDGRYDDIASEANKHLSGRSLVAAMVNGSARSFMTSYNPITHETVLDLLRDQGLDQSIIGWNVSVTEMICDFKVTDIGKGIVTALRVGNGHSGHRALRFTAALRAPGYEFEAGGQLRRDRRRHLSHVSEMLAELRSAVDDVVNIKLDVNLGLISYAEALQLITNALPNPKVRQMQVLNAADAAKCVNALDVIAVVAPYGMTPGWASAVASVLDPIVRHAMGMSNGGVK